MIKNKKAIENTPMGTHATIITTSISTKFSPEKKQSNPITAMYPNDGNNKKSKKGVNSG
jgi:hypothetical protein